MDNILFTASGLGHLPNAEIARSPTKEFSMLSSHGFGCSLYCASGCLFILCLPRKQRVRAQLYLSNYLKVPKPCGSEYQKINASLVLATLIWCCLVSQAAKTSVVRENCIYTKWRNVDLMTCSRSFRVNENKMIIAHKRTCSNRPSNGLNCA